MQTEPQALTVSQLNNLVKKLLETEFPQIWVEGEIPILNVIRLDICIYH